MKLFIRSDKHSGNWYWWLNYEGVRHVSEHKSKQWFGLKGHPCGYMWTTDESVAWLRRLIV